MTVEPVDHRGTDARSLRGARPTAATDPSHFTVALPPRVISVGVTGHRALTRAEEDAAAGAVANVLTVIDRLAGEAGALPERRLLTALAAGADQVAAAAAPPGWQAHAVLPFDERSYRAVLARDLDPPAAERALAEFDTLLANAARRFRLADLVADPSADEATAYTEARRYRTAGRVVVAQADLLLAIWRGGPPRGPGGTADCVAEALAQRQPVLRIDPSTGAVCLLDPETRDADLLWRTAEQPGVPANDPRLAEILAPLVASWLAPPAETQRLGSAAHFLGLGRYSRRQETAPGRTPAVFGLFAWFTWLLLIGSSAARRPGFRPRSDALAQAWPAKPSASVTDTVDALLRPASIAADAIATARGNAYRSGYVATFVGASLAVLVGLGGIADELHKPFYVAAELTLLVSTIGLFGYAHGRRYHARWLNARYIAELLRGQRALGWLGMAGRRPAQIRDEWSRWLADAVLASPGVPDATFDRATLATIAEEMKAQLVTPQIAYHKRNATVMRQVHRRLDAVGWACVLVALAGGAGYLVTVATYPCQPEAHHCLPEWLPHAVAILGAGAPLVAAAAAGIRFQGDFERFGDRSGETTEALEAIAARLERFVARVRAAPTVGGPLLFEELVAIAEALSAVLRADSDDWRFVYAARPLPGVG